MKTDKTIDEYVQIVYKAWSWKRRGYSAFCKVYIGQIPKEILGTVMLEANKRKQTAMNNGD